MIFTGRVGKSLAVVEAAENADAIGIPTKQMTDKSADGLMACSFALISNLMAH
jgi:hypothetical protein